MGLPRIQGYALPRAAEILPVRAPWRFEPQRAALLIHDMQRYFVGAFVDGNSPIEPVIANIVRLKHACTMRGIPVFYTAQNGNQDRRDRGLQADLWGPGMTDGPDQQPIIPQLAPETGDIVLVKHRYSAFQMSNFAHQMAVRGRNQLIITGIYAHIGCLMTAGEAFQRDIEPFFVADAVADFSREKHDLAVGYVASTCGVAPTVNRLLDDLNQRSAA